MNLLANLLPGVRAVRTPLAAGAVVLVAVWLAVTPESGATEHSFIYERVREALQGLSATARVTVFAFTAYLIGTLVSSLVDVLTSVWIRNAWFGELTEWLRQQKLEPEVAIVGQESELGKRYDALLKCQPRSVWRWLPDTFSKDGLRRRRLRQREWRLLRFALLARDPELFSEVDRLEAEGRFRFAVGVSVVALGVVVLIRPELYDALLGVAVVLVGLGLVLASLRGEDEVERLVSELVPSGRIHLPLLDQLRPAKEEPVT